MKPHLLASKRPLNKALTLAQNHQWFCPGWSWRVTREEHGRFRDVRARDGAGWGSGAWFRGSRRPPLKDVMTEGRPAVPGGCRVW